MLRWDLWEGRYHGGHLLLCDTDSQAQHHWPGYWPTSNKKVVNSGFNCSAVCIASGGDYRPAVDYQRLQLQSTTMNSFRPSTNPCNLIPLLDSGVALLFNISASSCLVQVLLVEALVVFGGALCTKAPAPPALWQHTGLPCVSQPPFEPTAAVHASIPNSIQIHVLQIQIQMQIQNLLILLTGFVHAYQPNSVSASIQKKCKEYTNTDTNSVIQLFLYNYRNCISAPIWW